MSSAHITVTPTPGLIFILVDDRTDFDKIALPVKDNGPSKRGHVLVKTLEKDGVLVIFQHWLYYVNFTSAPELGKVGAA